MISDNNIMALVNLPLRFQIKRKMKRKPGCAFPIGRPPSEVLLPGLNIINSIEHLHNWIDRSKMTVFEVLGISVLV
jgi:hypothetical protein